MFIWLAVRPWLRAVWLWLVNAASAGWRTARTEARYAWETCFKERFRAASQQGWDAWVDDVATRAKASFPPTP
jgi:hypothetical protein